MSPVVTFEYDPEKCRLDRMIPAKTRNEKARAKLSSEVRSQFDKVQGYRSSGLPLIDAVMKVGLPAESWKLLGARRQRPQFASWQRRGQAATGQPHRIISGHLTLDCLTTFCGRKIPSTYTHTVRITLVSEMEPCQICVGLCTDREIRQVTEVQP